MAGQRLFIKVPNYLVIYCCSHKATNYTPIHSVLQAYYNGYQSLPGSMSVDLGVLFLNKTRVVGAIKNLGDGACIERLLDQNSNRVTKEVWLATESNQPTTKGDLHASDNHEESKDHD
jgi:hypothetical protein